MGHVKAEHFTNHVRINVLFFVHFEADMPFGFALFPTNDGGESVDPVGATYGIINITRDRVELDWGYRSANNLIGNFNIFPLVVLAMRAPRSIKLHHVSSIVRQIQILRRPPLELDLRLRSVIVLMHRLLLQLLQPTLVRPLLFFVLALLLPIIVVLPRSQPVDDPHIEIFAHGFDLLFPFVEDHFEFVPGEVSWIVHVLERVIFFLILFLVLILVFLLAVCVVVVLVIMLLPDVNLVRSFI
mmetsp:Transcript_17328/g.41566  ORF Transcript_17328/g.41566 Transcript_17328/m.41566 type:complete len:242 (-) Transcript_17328:321-1046(-)